MNACVSDVSTYASILFSRKRVCVCVLFFTNGCMCLDVYMIVCKCVVSFSAPQLSGFMVNTTLFCD